MGKHTPAPWRVAGRSGNNGEAYLIVSNDRDIAWTASSGETEDGLELVTPEDWANAELIANAPALVDKLEAELAEAEAKAIDSLARYKFAMFGYWAGIWVHLNRISGLNKPNPFKPLVVCARERRDGGA